MARLQSHGFLLVISLLLLQAGDSSPHSAALAAPGDSSSSATTPGPNRSQSPVANPPRVSPSPGNWVNVTSNLAGMTSECGNMTYVSAKPNEDLVIAGIALQGLWGSTDGGTSWHQLGSGGGSAKITNRPGSIIYDPARPNVFWQSGIYNGNGIYRTDNNGKVFRALGSIGHNDTVSVDFTDLNRRTLLAGGHEQRQTVYRSQDGGNTWTNVGVESSGRHGLLQLSVGDQSQDIFCRLLFQLGRWNRWHFPEQRFRNHLEFRFGPRRRRTASCCK